MIYNYLSASRLLHLITAMELFVLSIVVPSIHSHPIRIVIFVAGSLLTLFTQLDARSRFQEFKKVRDQLILYGPNRRIFMMMSGSRCQRDAAIAAAKQLFVDKQCSDCFRTAGYRWYHLMPDSLVRYPEAVFSMVFWRTTFFLPTYGARCAIGVPRTNGKDCDAAS